MRDFQTCFKLILKNKWKKLKKHFDLINSQKDSSRTKVIQMFPKVSSLLSKKKDANKADAILIASYFYETYRSE